MIQFNYIKYIYTFNLFNVVITVFISQVYSVQSFTLWQFVYIYYVHSICSQIYTQFGYVYQRHLSKYIKSHSTTFLTIVITCLFTESWHLINRHSRLTNVFPSINLIESIHATQHPVFKSRLSAHNIKQHGVDREKTEFGIPLLCSVVLWKQPTILFIVVSSFSKGFNVDCKDEERRRARLQGTPLRSTRYDYEHVYMLRRIQGFVNSYSIVTTMHFYCFLHIENKDIHNIKYK